jgi:hypothetical protein
LHISIRNEPVYLSCKAIGPMICFEDGSPYIMV